MKLDVLVIGAGVSGLGCAFELAQRGLSVQVLEREGTPGGNAISERFDGFLMEHGPSTLNAAAHGALDRLDRIGLLDNAMDLGDKVQNRFLVDSNIMTSIPVHPLGFFTAPYLSIPAKIRLMSEIFRPKRPTNPNETIYQFVARRFGTEFAIKVIDPLAAGIFMGDAHKLSVNDTFPKLVEMEQKFGSVSRAVLQAKRGSQPGRRLLSWSDGIATIPQKLAALLGERVKTGVTVTKIAKTDDGFLAETDTGAEISAKAIVLAVPPHIAAQLLTDIEPETASALNNITAPPIAVTYLGYRRDQIKHPLDGLGFLSTRDDANLISGTQFCSTMYAGRAPENHVSISCYAGGARNPSIAEMPDTELVDRVISELSNLIGISGAPVVVKTKRWGRGLPQYDVGHAKIREKIETTSDRVPGLYLTGNYISGVSIGNCMQAAADTSNKVINWISQNEPRIGLEQDRIAKA